MKKLSLKHPVLFLQVFANLRDIPKDQRGNYKVKEILTMPESIISETGYFSEGVLFLQDDLRRSEEKLLSSGFVVLTDYLQTRFAGMEDILLFHDAKHPRNAGIFKMQMNGDNLSLSLNYSDNRYTIGDPARDDFRFGELHQGDSLRFTLNSKNDSHDQRKYCWFDYLFCGYEYVNEIVFDSKSKIRIPKRIPAKPNKKVELLKDIY